MRYHILFAYVGGDNNMDYEPFHPTAMLLVYITINDLSSNIYALIKMFILLLLLLLLLLFIGG